MTMQEGDKKMSPGSEKKKKAVKSTVSRGTKYATSSHQPTKSVSHAPSPTIMHESS